MKFWRVVEIMKNDVKDIKVYIFYSSRTEPEILSAYNDGLAKMRKKKIDYEVIDITEHKKKAKKYEIKSTPTICIIRDGELEKQYEGIANMKGVLGLALIGAKSRSRSA